MATRKAGTRYAASKPSARRPANSRSRRRPSFRFFIITGAFIVSIAVLTVLLLSPLPTAVVVWASTDYTADFDMLIVRDEVVYQAMNYGKTEFIAQEGVHIEEGEPIVKVYELRYNNGTLFELLDLQKKIMDYEINELRAGVIDQSLNDIDTRIDLKAKEIQASISSGRRKDLLGLEGDIESLLNERTSYLNNSVQPDDQLRQYLNREQEIKDAINEWCSVVTAETAGTVSFYFDGCESIMAKENIGSFTKKALEEISAGKTVSISEKDQAYKPLYRVVSEDNWYVVLLSENRIPEMLQGNVFSMVFDDYLDKQYTGSVYNIQELENNEGYVYTIKINENIGPMLGDRRVSARLATTIQGWRIPRSCLKPEDGVNYVENESGEYVPVAVVGSEGDSVLVQTYKDQPVLKENEHLKK
jgi:hypothetical protein